MRKDRKKEEEEKEVGNHGNDEEEEYDGLCAGQVDNLHSRSLYLFGLDRNYPFRQIIYAFLAKPAATGKVGLANHKKVIIN